MFRTFTQENNVTTKCDNRSISRSKTRSIERVVPENKEPNQIKQKGVNNISRKPDSRDTDAPMNANIKSNMTEADFLAKVTSFVAKYETENQYEEKVWPALTPEGKSDHTTGNPTTPLKKSPAKSYLEIERGTEWFGTSIELENTENIDITNKQENSQNKKNSNKLASGAALMRKHISATAPSKLHKIGIEGIEIPTKPCNDPDTEKNCRQKDANVMTVKENLENLDSQLKSKDNSKDLSPLVCITKIAPTEDEPGDIGIPTQLDRYSSERKVSNEEFYCKLVAGLRKITTPEPEADKDIPEPDVYRKYSHHLGRAEFGTLRKKDSTQSSSSNLKYQSKESVANLTSIGLSRDPSFDKINVKLAPSRRVSRQDSGEEARGQSKLSDASEALPDLELDEDLFPEIFSKREKSSSVIRRLSERNDEDGAKISDKAQSVTEDKKDKQEGNKTTDILAKKDEALKNVADHKQRIKEFKVQIQNGLMTMVGFGVMAYLTTLENMGGGGGQ